MIKILFIGDVVGKPGRRVVRQYLSENKDKYDLVFANGENLSAGKGITFDKYQEVLESGVDYFTSGNHVWSNDEFVASLDDPKVKVLRPLNYPAGSPGRGSAIIEAKGAEILLISLQGRVFMKDVIDDPFVTAKDLIDENKDKIVIIDFHAEATSEKIALGYYLDGRASAVLGTHTHVQTADEKILTEGTAYITDIGMSGPIDSVLGVKKEIIIEKFLTQMPLSHKVATGDAILNAVEIEIDSETKKAVSIKRISQNFKAQ